jgi:hypothetical protein
MEVSKSGSKKGQEDQKGRKEDDYQEKETVVL